MERGRRAQLAVGSLRQLESVKKGLRASPFELVQSPLDFHQLVEDEDVCPLGVDPYRAVVTVDESFDLTTYIFRNLWCHDGVPP